MGFDRAEADEVLIGQLVVCLALVNVFGEFEFAGCEFGIKRIVYVIQGKWAGLFAIAKIVESDLDGTFQGSELDGLGNIAVGHGLFGPLDGRGIGVGRDEDKWQMPGIPDHLGQGYPVIAFAEVNIDHAEVGQLFSQALLGGCGIITNVLHLVPSFFQKIGNVAGDEGFIFYNQDLDIFWVGNHRLGSGGKLNLKGRPLGFQQAYLSVHLLHEGLDHTHPKRLGFFQGFQIVQR